MSESHVYPLRVALEISWQLIQNNPELHGGPSRKDLALGSIALRLQILDAMSARLACGESRVDARSQTVCGISAAESDATSMVVGPAGWQGLNTEALITLSGIGDLPVPEDGIEPSNGKSSTVLYTGNYL